MLRTLCRARVSKTGFRSAKYLQLRSVMSATCRSPDSQAHGRIPEAEEWGSPGLDDHDFVLPGLLGRAPLRYRRIRASDGASLPPAPIPILGPRTKSHPLLSALVSGPRTKSEEHGPYVEASCAEEPSGSTRWCIPPPPIEAQPGRLPAPNANAAATITITCRKILFIVASPRGRSLVKGNNSRVAVVIPSRGLSNP